jgi:hypothetical protein
MSCTQAKVKVLKVNSFETYYQRKYQIMLRDTVPELMLRELLSVTCELTKALNIGQGLCLQTKETKEVTH